MQRTDCHRPAGWFAMTPFGDGRSLYSGFPTFRLQFIFVYRLSFLELPAQPGVFGKQQNPTLPRTVTASGFLLNNLRVQMLRDTLLYNA